MLRMPRLVRNEDVTGEDVAEAGGSAGAGVLRVACIQSLCGTKRNGFGHRAYIIAPAGSRCRDLSRGVARKNAEGHFILGSRKRCILGANSKKEQQATGA
jgi:hypothetical protein